MANIATRAAYGKKLAELGSTDENIVVLDADLSKSTNTANFAEKFPDRFINCGIAESNMMSVAAGLAVSGKTVFASTFAMFAAGRAFEQIRNSICYPNLNVKVCASHAGISVGEDGATHQCIEDLAIMRAIPNITVISPADAIETEQAIEAIAKIKTPAYVRLGRLAVAEVNSEGYRFQLGKGVELKSGDDLTIIATGLMVQKSLEAAEILTSKGINARVINIHTIKPIDKDIIEKAAKETKFIITAEEHNIIGGLGSAVAEVLACSDYKAKLMMVGVEDKFGKSGKPDELFEVYGLTKENIAEKAINLIKE